MYIDFLGGFIMKINLTNKDFTRVLYLCSLGSYIIKNSELKNSLDSEAILYQLLTSNPKLLKIDASLLKDTNELTETILDSITIPDNISIKDNLPVKNNYIDAYNELCFWRLLANKLASRDIIEDMDKCLDQGKSYGEYIELRKKIEKDYLKEFKNAHYQNEVLPY